jgi:hypothetical protein
MTLPSSCLVALMVGRYARSMTSGSVIDEVQCSGYRRRSIASWRWRLRPGIPICSRSAPMAAVYAVKGWGSLWIRVMMSRRVSRSSSDIWLSLKSVLQLFSGKSATQQTSSLLVPIMPRPARAPVYPAVAQRHHNDTMERRGSNTDHYQVRALPHARALVGPYVDRPQRVRSSSCGSF